MKARLVPAMFVALLAGCAAGPPPKAPPPPSLAELRAAGGATRERAAAGEWLFAELVSPGGTPPGARRARARVEALGAGDLVGELALGLDDAVHGRPAAAAEHYLSAVRASHESLDPRAGLVAWFAASRALALHADPRGTWDRHRAWVEERIRQPGNLGWRARGELVEWSLDRARAARAPDIEARTVAAYGCVTEARIAGPFGRGMNVDATRSFPAEGTLPWPARFAADPLGGRVPEVLPVEARGCSLRASHHPGDGVYYAETHLELTESRDVLIAVQGALLLEVDGEVVLRRDPRDWGVWPRFGVALRLVPGRHRIVARLTEPATAIRLMHLDGTPLGARTSRDPAPGHVVVVPEVLPDPNVLARIVRDGRVTDPGDAVSRYLGAALAHLESSDDVGSVIAEPLVREPARATGPALALAALLAAEDPILERAQSKDLVRELHDQALRRDPALWGSRLALALGAAERKGAADVVPSLLALRRDFPAVPEVGLALARVQGELGYVAERAATVAALARDFPHEPAVLRAAGALAEERGDAATADALFARLAALDPWDETPVERATAREDDALAVKLLAALSALDPTDRDLAARLADARVRQGRGDDPEARLVARVAENPTSARAHLALADLRLSRGEPRALERSLVAAVEAGAPTAALTAAIDLRSGRTELEPFRLRARDVIREFERSGVAVEGTAARVLDYAALFVRADGSSRMLEHEIVRIQSAEAASKLAEHRALEGDVLHLRVIKRDGTVLEPEVIAGKPTVTLPHLEIGDYVETEQILASAGDGRGARYAGPRWFFREENVGYARSELVLISPKSRPLVLETTGLVPEPRVEERDGLVIRRFRVDESPPAPVEPGSAPLAEFLPSLTLGWGQSLDLRLGALADAMVQLAPVDPRVERLARELVEGIPPGNVEARARRLYRFLAEHVEPGDEADGRRVVFGRHGNLWQGFRMLCRATGVPVRFAVAESRLATPPRGPLSEAARFTQPVAEIPTRGGSIWLTLGGKYTPFGWLPSDLRGMPARLLDGSIGREVRLPEGGVLDSVELTGKGRLAADGSLALDLAQRFTGKLAMQLRRGLDQLPEERLHSVLETQMLAQTFRGGELQRHVIEGRDELDAPLTIRMTVRVPRFAERAAGALVVTPPFGADLARLATLPERRTPLLLSEALHRRVALQVELPAGATTAAAAPRSVEDGARRVTVADRLEGRTLRLERSLTLPAGRIAPSDYERFARFAHDGEALLTSPLRVRLR